LNCSYSTDSAGLFVWGLVPESVMNVEQWIEDILQSANVFLTPGFIFGSNGDRYVRISLCSDLDTLDVALERVGTYLNK